MVRKGTEHADGRTDRMAGWRAEKLGNKRLEAAKNIVEWK